MSKLVEEYLRHRLEAQEEGSMELKKPFDAKFHCPVCGCPTERINANCINPQERLFQCPDCKSVLQGIGRVWSLVKKSEPQTSLTQFIQPRRS